MHYYLFEQSGGTQVLRSDNPQPHWVLVPEDAVDQVFAAMGADLPVRVAGGALEVADRASPAPGARWDWDLRQWVGGNDPDTGWQLVREQRDALLRASDWTQLPDLPDSTRATWRAYRQELRDVTEQSDPFSIAWPVAPSSSGLALLPQKPEPA